jgi:hypothetical protein
MSEPTTETTKAKKTDKAPDGSPPVEIAQATQVPLVPAQPPKGPSPRQAEAQKYHEQMEPIVDELCKGDPSDASSPMKRMGAALMATHMAMKDPRAHAGLPPLDPAATPKQIQAYANIFRSRFPGAWGAANRCDVANFIRFLVIAGLRGWPENEDTCELADVPVEQMIVEYQSSMSKLGAVAQAD